VVETDLDGPVIEANAITALDVRTLRIERLVLEAEMGCDALRIGGESLHQLPTGTPIHRGTKIARLPRMRVPIFPLDNVVLFPSVQVPLYIFEPRYRQMTAAALEEDLHIGMVAVQPQHLDAMSGDPPVFPVGCLGEIGHSEPHEDGTYHLILQGTSRFRIEAEVPKEAGREYRLANVKLLEEEPDPPGNALEPVRARVLDLMCRIAPDRAASFRVELFTHLDNATFVNAFCQSLDFSTLEKQPLLEANSVRGRAEQLVALMDFRLASQSLNGAPSPNTIH